MQVETVRAEAHPLLRLGRNILRWFDTGPLDERAAAAAAEAEDRVEWSRIIPFVAMHLTCLTVIWVGWSPVAVVVAIVAYLVRMFAITGFYHRYFSHRSFKTSRAFQLVLAILAMTTAQRGVLWWAGHHRRHHRYSDSPEDVHSARRDGFWWAHIGWITSETTNDFGTETVKDLEPTEGPDAVRGGARATANCCAGTNSCHEVGHWLKPPG